MTGVQTCALPISDKAVQLDPTRINQSTDANGWMHFRGTYGLDTRLSYGGAAPVALGANQTAMGGSNDNPSVGSAKAITLIEKDQFIQYCMYKPNTPDSIWVAVGRLIWGCDGTVSRPTKFDPWGAVTGGATPVSPSGAAYNGPPPEWTVVWNSSTPYAPGP